jgi:hypothetical protein
MNQEGSDISKLHCDLLLPYILGLGYGALPGLVTESVLIPSRPNHLDLLLQSTAAVVTFSSPQLEEQRKALKAKVDFFLDNRPYRWPESDKGVFVQLYNQDLETAVASWLKKCEEQVSQYSQTGKLLHLLGTELGKLLGLPLAVILELEKTGMRPTALENFAKLNVPMEIPFHDIRENLIAEIQATRLGNIRNRAVENIDREQLTEQLFPYANSESSITDDGFSHWDYFINDEGVAYYGDLSVGEYWRSRVWEANLHILEMITGAVDVPVPAESQGGLNSNLSEPPTGTGETMTAHELADWLRETTHQLHDRTTIQSCLKESGVTAVNPGRKPREAYRFPADQAKKALQAKWPDLIKKL